MVYSNILDPIHKTLDPTVWDNADSAQPTLKGRHRTWIVNSIIHVLEEAGYENVKSWLDLVLTGSLTTYQYSEDSDCDVSLFVNTDHFPEWSRAEMISVMVEHLDGKHLPGTTHPMQNFVVAPGIMPEMLYQPGLRSGYKLTSSPGWIVPPERNRVHNIEQEMNASYVYALECADKMERLLQYEPDHAIQYWHMIHRQRMRDQRAGLGDFTLSNIVYKFLAKRGLLPEIAQASGEYIAKTAWSLPGQRGKQVLKDMQTDRINNAIQRRNALWTHAFSQNKSPTDFLPMNGFGEFRPVPEDANWGGKDYSAEANYRARLIGQDLRWHQDYQKQIQNKFLNNPDATGHDYEAWWDWYRQHAPQHAWDPEGAAANAEVAPQEAKPWYAKTASPYSWMMNKIYERNIRHQFSQVPGDEFHKAYQSVLNHPQFGKHVEPYNREDLNSPAIRTYLGYGGTVGGALKDHGDGRLEATGLFNMGGPPGTGGQMLQHLQNQGANYLTAIGESLRDKYLSNGWQVNSVWPWDDGMAPDNWDYHTHGRPDVYEMNYPQNIHTSAVQNFDVDPDALEQARAHLELEHPINVNLVPHAVQQSGGYYSGRYQGIQDGAHQVDLVNWVKPDTANRLLWHELTHAAQHERDPQQWKLGMPAYLDQQAQGYDQYMAHPWEMEANEKSAQPPFSLVTTPTRKPNEQLSSSTQPEWSLS